MVSFQTKSIPGFDGPCRRVTTLTFSPQTKPDTLTVSPGQSEFKMDALKSFRIYSAFVQRIGVCMCVTHRKYNYRTVFIIYSYFVTKLPGLPSSTSNIFLALQKYKFKILKYLKILVNRVRKTQKFLTTKLKRNNRIFINICTKADC